jgi:hypothetical protein
MNADGSLQTQVLPAPTTFGCNPFPPDALGAPAWSPDGSKIVFSRFTCTRDPDSHEIPAYDLYTVKPDGTGEARLVTEGTGPRWSPDGTKVGYTHFCFGGGCTDVRWTTADGSQQFLVYQTDLSAESFIDWSPDGQLMNGCGEGYCFTVHPDGTGLQKNVPVGHWSPDGKKLTSFGYVAGPPGQYDIFTYNTDGSAQTNITNTPNSDEFGADWQPIPYTGYPRPKGASPFQTYLVPAYKQCPELAANRTHGAPLAFPSCNPPVQTSNFLTVGTPDANGQGAKSRGIVFFAVRPDNPPTSPADVVIATSITDVRNKAGLTDYTGGLQEVVTWRVTDNYNGPSLTEPATMVDIPFPVNVPCTVTPDLTVGSTCAIRTTANAVVPGTVKPKKRMIVALGQAQVYDGGASGVPGSADATLFLDQGIFIP